MNKTRILTGIIGFPLVILLFIYSNKFIIDIVASIIACIGIHEYFNACKKEVKNISVIGYILALGIIFIHIVNTKFVLMSLAVLIPILLMAMFLYVIITDMEITLKDAVFAFFGILYVISFIVFIPLIYGIGDTTKLAFFNGESFVDNMIDLYKNTVVPGKYLMWYLIFTAWGSDTFAYTVGKNFGKHKFSKVSPNKTIEGCVAGVVGAVILAMLYTMIINNTQNFDINYFKIGIASAIFCLIGQIGDFSASTIKRYFDIKDYSNLFPGHGGMLDRIDSVMFIAPFAFCFFTFVL